MAARVIHFGSDDCYRMKVLRRAGYQIDSCHNVVELCNALESESGTDAVMVNDGDGSESFQAISIVRSRTTAPIILFPSSTRSHQTEEVDLVVPTFTPPEEWLLDLANLIVRSRQIRAYSQMLHEQSQALRRASADVRERSLRERQRSREARDIEFPSPFDSNRDPN